MNFKQIFIWGARARWVDPGFWFLAWVDLVSAYNVIVSFPLMMEDACSSWQQGNTLELLLHSFAAGADTFVAWAGAIGAHFTTSPSLRL